MAEKISENNRQLSRFKRVERIHTGAKRLQIGQEIPIGVKASIKITKIEAELITINPKQG